MKQIFLLFAFLLFQQIPIKACSCFAPTNYCSTMQTFEADLVLIGFKTMDMHHGMKVKVLNVLVGNELRDTLTVWGDNGALCRVYTSTFGLADTLLFALNHCDLAGNWLSPDTLEEVGHYHISVCGVYWLNYSNGTISGALDEGLNSLSLTDFVGFHIYIKFGS